jgi:hypothetical protein
VPCPKCIHFGPEHWAELIHRGKHGGRNSRSSTSSHKSKTPVPEDEESKGSISKVKDSEKVETPKHPKGKAAGPPLGASSEVVLSLNSQNACKCTVKGFPPAARVHEEGAIAYDFMDDEGGSWDFLGIEDRVLVQWHIYDGTKNVVDNGKTTYSLPCFEDIIRKLEEHEYTFNDACRDESWGFQVRKRAPIVSPVRGRSPLRRSRGSKRPNSEISSPSKKRGGDVRSPSTRRAPEDNQLTIQSPDKPARVDKKTVSPATRSAPALTAESFQFGTPTGKGRDFRPGSLMFDRADTRGAPEKDDKPSAPENRSNIFHKFGGSEWPTDTQNQFPLGGKQRSNRRQDSPAPEQDYYLDSDRWEDAPADQQKLLKGSSIPHARGRRDSPPSREGYRFRSRSPIRNTIHFSENTVEKYDEDGCLVLEPVKQHTETSTTTQKAYFARICNGRGQYGCNMGCINCKDKFICKECKEGWEDCQIGRASCRERV